MLEIRPTTVAELEAAPNFSALLDEYAAESSIAGLPHPKAKLDTYKIMESSGMFKVFGAWYSGELVGFIAVLTCILPHYSEYISVTESFFVSARSRNTGAGLKLLCQAEAIARDLKSKGLLVSAPSGGSLASVLKCLDYKETNRVFFKAVA